MSLFATVEIARPSMAPDGAVRAPQRRYDLRYARLYLCGATSIRGAVGAVRFGQIIPSM